MNQIKPCEQVLMSGNNKQKFQSHDICRWGSYKTQCSTMINFRSLTFSYVCKFKVTFKKFLLINSFHSLEEYFTFDAKFDPHKN